MGSGTEFIMDDGLRWEKVAKNMKWVTFKSACYAAVSAMVRAFICR